jgi:phosphopantothenoylcysteine synthetase/decarboxylase
VAKTDFRNLLVIDDTVITGSHNFSRSAQLKAENILFLESAALTNATAFTSITFCRNMPTRLLGSK